VTRWSTAAAEQTCYRKSRQHMPKVLSPAARVRVHGGHHGCSRSPLHEPRSGPRFGVQRV